MEGTRARCGGLATGEIGAEGQHGAVTHVDDADQAIDNRQAKSGESKHERDQDGVGRDADESIHEVRRMCARASPPAKSPAGRRRSRSDKFLERQVAAGVLGFHRRHRLHFLEHVVDARPAFATLIRYEGTTI